MRCTIKICDDFAIVNSDEKKDSLKLDLSAHYCRIFETSKQQSRDYIDELLRWCGARPENLESLYKSLYMYVLVKRKQFGLKN